MNGSTSLKNSLYSRMILVITAFFAITCDMSRDIKHRSMPCAVLRNSGVRFRARTNPGPPGKLGSPTRSMDGGVWEFKGCVPQIAEFKVPESTPKVRGGLFPVHSSSRGELAVK
ncbi:hypothetical protein ACJJTC_009815 [Scirpophaga incertulas]